MTEKPNACCNDPENLLPHHEAERPDMTAVKCHVCGCRHFELSVDPGVIKFEGAPA